MSKIGKLRQRLAGIRDAKEPMPERIRGFGDPLLESESDYKSRKRQSDYMTIWKGTTIGPNKEEVDYANRKEGWGDASGKWERERAGEAMDMQPNQAGITGAIKIKGVYKKPQNREYYDSAHTDVAPRKPFGVGPLNRPITRSQTETPLLKEVPFGPMLKRGDRRRKPQRYRINEPAVPDLLSKRDPNPFRIRPRKPTQAERSEIITAKQLRQRIAQVRLAVRPKKVASTKQEVINAMKEGKPMRTEKPLRHGERLPPTYETDGKNFLLYGNKILSKQGDGYQTHVKDFINEDNYEQITLDTLRDFGMKVDSNGVIDSTKQFFTKDGLAMETKTNGDLTKSDMIIPANEISEGRVLVNKYKPPTGIKRDTYPYTPENLRNFAAESRRRVTSMQVNSEGRKVPEGTLKGDPTGIRKRSLSETATQPEDAKEVNRILGLPEEQGLEKTFGKRYDKEKTKTTYNKGKYKGIEGSKTHHILFKETFKEKNKQLPLARFKHTRNVKATPKGSFANPFANNPSNAIQLSKPEHKELHRLNPHSNFRNIMESKLRIARLKIAGIRQRNISRGVPRIAMGQKALDVMNVFNKNPLRHRDRKGGFTFDHLNNRFLDASKRREALEIRKTFGAEEGKNFGLNSITWTDKGKIPQKDLKIIQRDLHSVEDDYKKDPILGGYEDSFEATFGVSGSNEEILSQLNDDQLESLIIDPNGYAFFKDHAGKETRLTELSPKYSDTAIKDSGGGKPNPLR